MTRIDNRKKLLDFSEVILTVPNSFIMNDELASLNELSMQSFLQDLILVYAIKDRYNNSQIIAGKFANIRLSESSCSEMKMKLVQIDNQGKFIQL